MAEYYGPQYDIQFGYNHQGYGVVTNDAQGLGNGLAYTTYCMNFFLCWE